MKLLKKYGKDATDNQSTKNHEQKSIEKTSLKLDKLASQVVQSDGDSEVKKIINSK